MDVQHAVYRVRCARGVPGSSNWPRGGNLTNTHIRLGDSFLETVCPTDLAWERSTTQTRLLERNGDCGYMAIVQVPDVSVASRSMSAQGNGIGIVSGDWNVCPGSPGSGLAGVEAGRYVLGESLPKEPGTVSGVNVQFHPRDFGTLAEIQENFPGHGEFPRNKGAYFPAGNTWQNGVDAPTPRQCHDRFRRRRDRAPGTSIRGRCVDAGCVGSARGCSIDPDEPTTLRLAAGQTMRFVEPGPDGRTGVVGVDLWGVAGTEKKFDELFVCGVKWRLVEPPGG